jgi:hypothetical protein
MVDGDRGKWVHAIHQHYKSSAPWMLLRVLSTFADPTLSITVILYSRKKEIIGTCSYLGPLTHRMFFG